ncbi:MAG: flagellar motor protein MotA, partial [Rhodospirillaceae bacterium]|nr:flagellar motor protein MotA [Rhodospirillaceae bacterium]
NQHLVNLNDTLLLLADKHEIQTQLISKISESQIELNSNLSKVIDPSSDKNKEELRLHIRNIEKQLMQLINELRLGRDKSVEEIRQEIRLLARTIAVLAEEAE